MILLFLYNHSVKIWVGSQKVPGVSKGSSIISFSVQFNKLSSRNTSRTCLSLQSLCAIALPFLYFFIVTVFPFKRNGCTVMNYGVFLIYFEHKKKKTFEGITVTILNKVHQKVYMKGSTVIYLTITEPYLCR